MDINKITTMVITIHTPIIKAMIMDSTIMDKTNTIIKHNKSHTLQMAIKLNSKFTNLSLNMKVQSKDLLWTTCAHLLEQISQLQPYQK